MPTQLFLIYALYEHNNLVASNNYGTWILKFSEGKNHVYHCVAEHIVENVTSTNNATITVNGELAKVFLLSILILNLDIFCMIDFKILNF